MPSAARAGFVAFLFALVALSFTRTVEAQVRIQTEIGAAKIEVGDAVQFQITAMSSGDDTPSNPRLPGVPGLSISGPNLMTRNSINFTNGSMVRQTGVTATWSVQALKVGTYRIGPATVDLGGQRFTGEPKTLVVVPQNSLPRAPPRSQPFDPFRMFDPFGGGSPFPPGLFGPGDDDLEPQAPPPVPEEYKLDRAPDKLAFLRATITPKHPVVGQEVTVRFYTYGGRGPYNVTNPVVEATHSDFLSYIEEDDAGSNDAVRVPVGDTTFIAIKVRGLFLYPTRAGHLTVGPMTVGIDGPRYHKVPTLTRSSPELSVDVVEPPLDGRPAGYRLGDVGQFKLSATVDPRQVTAGDTIGVVAQLDGETGMLAEPRVPQQRGVEWLDPTHVDQVKVSDNGVHITRTFTYLVKTKAPGHFELGELTLPYWDPSRRVYATARAELGSIDVKPNPKQAAVAAAAPSSKADFSADPLDLKPRRQLRAYSPEEAPFTDSSRFWYFLFGAPLAVALTGVSIDLGGRLRRKHRAALSSPLRLAQEALGAAESAAKGSEIAKTAAAVERALFLAIEAGTSIRARALLKADLESALASAGVDEKTIAGTLELLDACESARFTGRSAELPPKELCARARRLVAELGRKRRSA